MSATSNAIPVYVKEPHPFTKKLQNLYSWFEYAKSGVLPNEPEMEKIQQQITAATEEFNKRKNLKNNKK